MNYILIIYKRDGTHRYVGLFTDRVAAIEWGKVNVKDGDHWEATPINLLPAEPAPTESEIFDCPGHGKHKYIMGSCVNCGRGKPI